MLTSWIDSLYLKRKTKLEGNFFFLIINNKIALRSQLHKAFISYVLSSYVSFVSKKLLHFCVAHMWSMGYCILQRLKDGPQNFSCQLSFSETGMSSDRPDVKMDIFTT